MDWNALDDVIYGCANQAGEDNRNVARMALLLAGLAKEISGQHGEPAVRIKSWTRLLWRRGRSSAAKWNW